MFPNRNLTCFFAAILLAALPCLPSVLLLAPEDDQFVMIQDFFVSFSVTDNALDIRRVKMFFDHEDISAKLRVTSNTISFIPDRVFLSRPDLEGPHMVTLIIYGQYREKLDEVSVKFYLSKEEEPDQEKRESLIEKGKDLAAVQPVDFVNSGKIYAAAGYESYRDSGNYSGEFDAYANGYRGNWFYNSYIYLNTEENPHEQTLQRFMVSTGYTKNYMASFGDVWPSYNAFLLDNQRVRGIELNLKTPKRAAGIDVVYGLASRKVAPYLYSAQALDTAIALHDTALGLFGHNDSMMYYEDGTYKRRMLATRLHFGTGRVFQCGVDFLKATDDTSSINQIYAVDITADGDTLVAINGETPKDNIAIGFDAQVNMWNQRLVLFTDYGLSFLTRNTIGGYVSSDEISDSGTTINPRPEDIHRILIVNGSTIPLPIPATDNESVNARSLAKAMVWDAGCRLDLPIGKVRDLFEFRYFILGPNFASLGNENLQVNRNGFEASDEVRLLGGKINFKGSLEYFHDNLNEVKEAPTRSLDLRLLASFIWDQRFPYATLSYIFSDEKGESTLDSAFSDNHNKMNSTGLSLQYARTVGSIEHTISLSYSNSLAQIASEKLPDEISLTMNTIVLSLHSRPDESPLETRASVSTNLSRGEYGVNLGSWMLGARWHYIAGTLYMDYDIGHEYTRNWGTSAEHEVYGKTSLNLDIKDRHTVYATASLNKIIGTSYVSPAARASYEFRF